MPQTKYTVAGSSTTRPENLPDGLTVREETAPVHVAFMTALGTRRVMVAERARTARGVEPRPFALRVSATGSHEYIAAELSREDAAKLRDALNAMLGETAPAAPAKARIVKDGQGDRWYETAPGSGLFGLGSTKDPRPYSLERISSWYSGYTEVTE